MATLYFNAAYSSNWDDLLNWWQDDAFTVAATAIPATGDTAYIESGVYTGPSVAITLAALFVAQLNSGTQLYDSGAGISTTGDLIVGKSTYLSGTIDTTLTIGGTAYFYGSSINISTITVSLANFYQTSNNANSGVITGDAVFNDSSYNQYGTVDGDATFNGSSYNQNSTVGGNATFNDTSSNNTSGVITGNATFNDLSSNGTGATVGGNATFNDNSTNAGTVSGNASVYYPVAQPLGGTVTGTITYSGYPNFYFNAAVDHTWDNASNWWRDSAFSVPAGVVPTANSTVYLEASVTTEPSHPAYLYTLFIAQINNAVRLANVGEGRISTTGDLTVGMESSLYGRVDNCILNIGGVANFYGSNGGSSSILKVDQANFYNSTSNYGIAQGAASDGYITGNATFNNSAQNFYTVASDAIFNDSSSNANGGIVEGSATFNGTSYNGNGATAQAGATFNGTSYNANGGAVDEGATFNGTSYNASGATVDGGATFNGTSYNAGVTAYGNVIFNGTSYNASGGTVDGNVTFNGTSYNASGATVDGAATFNNSSSNNGLISGNAYVYYPVVRPLGGTVTGTIAYIGYVSLYFNAAADHTWDNVLNWWQNPAFTIQASAIPAGGATVYVEAHITTGPVVAVTLQTLFVAQINNGVTLSAAGAGISTTGDLTVGLGPYLYGTVDIDLTVGGTAYFYGSSGGNSSGLTAGTSIFYLGASNTGAITGNAVFHDNAKNYGSVSGTATFDDISSNNTDGGIAGDLTFTDSSYNVSATAVGGNAIFRNSSYNTGTVTGNASVYYPATKPLGGTVDGTITYFSYP
jgi:hypothetical protein